MSVKQSTNHIGQGLSGEINGQKYRIGSASFVGATDIKDSMDQAVYLVDESQVLAKFLLVDAIRADAAETVKLIKESGCLVSIASGDSSNHVEEVANKIGIDDVNKGLSPEGKLQLVRQYQTRSNVAMFGDGINDAPVLAGANLSIAMGSGAAVPKARLILSY